MILTGVTDRTCSPRTSTDGSGPPTRWPWPPPTPATGSTTGPTLEAWGSSSQITGRRSNSTGPPSHVWQFSTIITEMVSDTDIQIVVHRCQVIILAVTNLELGKEGRDRVTLSAIFLVVLVLTGVF